MRRFRLGGLEVGMMSSSCLAPRNKMRWRKRREKRNKQEKEDDMGDDIVAQLKRMMILSFNQEGKLARWPLLL